MNMPFILKDWYFSTENDNVHCTRETARVMLNHWVACLNLTASKPDTGAGQGITILCGSKCYCIS